MGMIEHAKLHTELRIDLETKELWCMDNATHHTTMPPKYNSTLTENE